MKKLKTKNLSPLATGSPDSRPARSRAGRTASCLACSPDRAGELRRAVESYISADRSFNYDCNTRLDAPLGDPKRRKLLRASQHAFREMVSAYKRIAAVKPARAPRRGASRANVRDEPRGQKADKLYP
jgi:hypothetical protein